MLHIFQTSNIKSFNYKKDNTLALIQESLNKGYETWHYNVNDLSYSSENGFLVKANNVKEVNLNSKNFITFKESKFINLEQAKVIHLRNDPPFDMNYITNTYLLEKLEDRILFVNKPSVIRNFPEKIIPLLFKNLIPKTLVTSNIAEIENFRKSFQSVIIKPLYFFGGQLVYKIDNKKKLNHLFIKRLLKKINSPLIVQEFLPEVKLGDKRVVIIGGKIVGSVLRIPQKKSFLANLMQGGVLQKCSLSQKEEEIANKISVLLKKYNVISCGIDIIGQKLTEINITSPIGYRELELLYGINAKKLYFDAIDTVNKG